jgi:crotonobetainyl-CoA:carnitine CoA-transferase CaiB-like acyl-CoA transferase
MIQGMGGLMSVTGEADGQPGGGPQKVGVALADVMTGLYATIGILAAVAHRNETGEGQQIDLALLDVQTATLANQAMNYLISGKPPERLGNAHPNIVPYQAFAASDGHFIVAVGNDGQFRRLCELLGESEWGKDSRFATNADRVENRAQLVPLLIEKFKQRTTAEWMGSLEEVNVPCGPINTIDQVFDDPQVQHRNMQVNLSHAQAGSVALVGNPIKLSGTESDPRSAPPMLGEQTEGVLRDLLGLDDEALQALRVRGVV